MQVRQGLSHPLPPGWGLWSSAEIFQEQEIRCFAENARHPWAAMDLIAGQGTQACRLTCGETGRPSGEVLEDDCGVGVRA